MRGVKESIWGRYRRACDSAAIGGGDPDSRVSAGDLAASPRMLYALNAIWEPSGDQVNEHPPGTESMEAGGRRAFDLDEAGAVGVRHRDRVAGLICDSRSVRRPGWSDGHAKWVNASVGDAS